MLAIVLTFACLACAARKVASSSVSIKWTNYRASSEQACFYFEPINETLSAPTSSKRTVGPVGFKETEEVVVPMTDFFITDPPTIMYGYSMTNSSVCPENPALGVIYPATFVAGRNQSEITYRMSRLYSPPAGVGSDWMPHFMLLQDDVGSDRPHVQLLEEDRPTSQGLVLRVQTTGSLCRLSFDGDAAFDDVSGYSKNYPSYEDWRDSDRIPVHCPQSLSPHKEMKATVNCTGKWIGEVSFRDLMPSVCDIETSAMLTATLVGDGSDDFPYEQVFHKTPPSAFSCAELQCPPATTTTSSSNAVGLADRTPIALLSALVASWSAPRVGGA